MSFYYTDGDEISIDDMACRPFGDMSSQNEYSGNKNKEDIYVFCYKIDCKSALSPTDFQERSVHIIRFVISKLLIIVGILSVLGGCSQKNDSLVTEKRQWPPTQDESKMLEMHLVSQQWQPLGAGNWVKFNGEKHYMTADFATLILKLNVKNISDKPLSFSPLFHFIGIENADNLIFTSRNKEIRDNLQIRPHESVPLEVQSFMTPLNEYGKVIALTCTTAVGNWNWDLNPLPSHDVLFGKNVHCLHQTKVKLLKQEWSVIPAGQSIGSVDGTPASLNTDMAGLDITLQVANPTNSELGFCLYPELRDKNGISLTKFFDSIKHGRQSQKLITIPPGQTVTVALDMELLPYDQLLNAAPLKIVEDSLGINESVIKMPEKVLSPKYDRGQKTN